MNNIIVNKNSMTKIDKLKIVSALFVFSVLILFTSCEHGDETPLVKFGQIQNLYTALEDRTETSAILSAQILAIDSGVVVNSKGICWGLNVNPTIKDKKIQFEQGGLGVFKVEATGLKSGTTYYFRSYMIGITGIQYSACTTFYTYQPL